jgi:hypothetical protein
MEIKLQALRTDWLLSARFAGAQHALLEPISKK